MNNHNVTSSATPSPPPSLNARLNSCSTKLCQKTKSYMANGILMMGMVQGDVTQIKSTHRGESMELIIGLNEDFSEKALPDFPDLVCTPAECANVLVNGNEQCYFTDENEEECAGRKAKPTDRKSIDDGYLHQIQTEFEDRFKSLKEQTKKVELLKEQTEKVELLKPTTLPENDDQSIEQQEKAKKIAKAEYEGQYELALDNLKKTELQLNEDVKNFKENAMCTMGESVPPGNVNVQINNVQDCVQHCLGTVNMGPIPKNSDNDLFLPFGQTDTEVSSFWCIFGTVKKTVEIKSNQELNIDKPKENELPNLDEVTVEKVEVEEVEVNECYVAYSSKKTQTDDRDHKLHADCFPPLEHFTGNEGAVQILRYEVESKHS